MNTAYLLADDLSGAQEVGASFHARGCRVRVPLGPVTSDETVLEVVTTETRNASPAAASRAVISVLRRQREAGRRLLFKKIDSTLRGPLGAEVTALVETLLPPLVVICPANPATGRSVVAGVLRLNGTPLADTDFCNDPIWPARTSRIADLWPSCGSAIAHLALADLRSGAAGLRIDETRRAGARILISDAETADDLDGLLAVTRSVCSDAVFVGAGGLGDAIARTVQPVVPSSSAVPEFSSLLAICGSRHPASHRQMEQLAASFRAPLITITPGAGQAEKLRGELPSLLKAHRVVALRFDPGHPADPASLMRETSAIVAAFSETVHASAFLFTGGETAGTACAALAGESLDILGTMEQAVVLSLLQRRNAAPVFVLTKPGGYGDDGVLFRAVGKVMK